MISVSNSPYSAFMTSLGSFFFLEVCICVDAVTVFKVEGTLNTSYDFGKILGARAKPVLVFISVISYKSGSHYK